MNETTVRAVLVTEGATCVTITLGEDLTPDEAPELLAAARAAAAAQRAVVVACGGPSFLPTGAVQILAALQRTCRERGHPFTVESVQESVAAYLRLGGLDAILRP